MPVEYTIAPKIDFMLSGSEIDADVWTSGTWIAEERRRVGVELRPENDPVRSGYDALVQAMRRGERTKRGLRVTLDNTAREELIEFLEAMYVGARDSEDYNDMAAIRRAYKQLGVRS